jgi:hypothetical protein
LEARVYRSSLLVSLLAAAVLLHLAPQTASAPPAPLQVSDTLPSGIVTIRLYEEWSAFTICGTKPTSWVRMDIDAEERAMVEAHEGEHRRLIATFPSCAAYQEWYRASEQNRIESEARAFCAGAKADLARGRYATLAEAVWEHARWFRWYFGNASQADAAAWIHHNCT